MFTVSVKVTKRQLIVAGAVLILAFAGGIWARAIRADLRGEEAQQSAVMKIEKSSGKTQNDRLTFLESFGWTVEKEETEIQEVMIPKEIDDVLAKYNEIQKGQGCDLTRYAGKRCKRYTYEVTNYPDHKENVRANLLVYNGKIIGGDICSLELNGFLHGFASAGD